MTKLEEFYQTLMRLKKPQISIEELDEGGDRTNYCLLKYIHSDGKEHTFQVRGWGKIYNGEININVVNWTMCGGTATLTLNEDIVDNWKIEEI